MRVRHAYSVFRDLSGNPLSSGYLLIGKQGVDPITRPQQAYWDESLTIPANDIQIKNGYPLYNGLPAQVYVKEPYSLLLQNSSRQTIIYKPFMRTPETNVVLSGYGPRYELTDEDTNVTIVVSPSASDARVVQNQGKATIRGLLDSTTPGSEGYLRLRAGQSIRITRLEESIQYSGVFAKIADPEVLPDLGLSAHWSPNGRYLAVGHAGGSNITVYDWSKGFPVKVASTALTLPALCNGVSWSPDGRYLATAHSSGNRASVFDWSSGNPVKVEPPSEIPEGTGNGVTWSPNGKYMAVAHGSSPYVNIYDWSGGTPVKMDDPLVLPSDQGRSVAWSPNGRYLAVGSTGSPYLLLYDWSTGVPVSVPVPSIPSSIISGTAWSPDGRYLAISYQAFPYITIYDWSSGAPVRLSDPADLPPEGVTSGVAWSPDGRYLAASSKASPFLIIYDWSTGAPVKVPDPDSMPLDDANAVAWSPDGRYLAVPYFFSSPYIIIYSTSSQVFNPWSVQLLDGPVIEGTDFI